MKKSKLLIILLIVLFAGCVRLNDNSKLELKKADTNIVQNQQISTVQNEQNKTAEINKDKKQDKKNKEKAENKDTAIKTNINEAYVKIIISKNSGKEILFEKKVKISKNTNAMMILKENADVYEEGGFIKSINKIDSVPPNNLSDEDKEKGIMGYDWFIYLNGKKTTVGAKDIILKNGDIINFDYKGWTIDDLAP